MDFLIQAERVLHSELGLGATLARLCAAGFLGFVIGLDREYRAHPAGMRTHMLVSLAAATFAILTYEVIARSAGERIQADPVRAIEAVTAGVAFLAAGTIIQSRGQVHGLTTGAGMWLAGAIGLSCGIGAFGLALMTTVLGVIILTLLSFVSSLMPKKADEDGR